MNIQVHLFASLAEVAGKRTVELRDLPEPATAKQVAEAVFQHYPKLSPMRGAVLYAVNAEYVRPDYPVRPHDDVALIPPVSGGADVDGGGPDSAYFRITSDPLDLQALHDLVLRSTAGAVSHFVGVVRDNNLGRSVNHLVYDAYPTMATKMMRQIADEIRARWEIDAVAIHHRTGRLEIGEPSVAIAVSAPHRADSIAACHHGIDRLKQIVPIWKKEVWSDGEHWIEGSLTPQEEAKPTPNPAESASRD